MQFSNIKIGEELYYLTVRNNCLRQRKVYFTDEEGYEWSRYTIPSREYSIKTLTFIGYSVTNMYAVDVKTSDAIVNSTGLELGTTYYVQFADGEIDSLTAESDLENYFQNRIDANIAKVEAEAVIDKL